MIILVADFKVANEDHYEWNKNKIVSILEKAAYPTEKGFKSVQDELIKIVDSGNKHPAYVVMEGERKKSIEMLRDARDDIDEQFAARKFTFSVEFHLRNARAAIKEGIKSKEEERHVYIDEYRGGSYDFGGGNGNYRTCDVNRVALGECEKAKKVLNSNPLGKGHPLVAEVTKLEEEAKKSHESICVSWAKKHAASGNVDKAQEFRDVRFSFFLFFLFLSFHDLAIIIVIV